MRRVLLDIGDDGRGRILVVFAFRQIKQFACADETFAQVADAADDLVQQRTLAPQRLGACGVVPDRRVFQFPIDLFQALLLGVVVKDTP